MQSSYCQTFKDEFSALLVPARKLEEAMKGFLETANSSFIFQLDKLTDQCLTLKEHFISDYQDRVRELVYKRKINGNVSFETLSDSRFSYLKLADYLEEVTGNFEVSPELTSLKALRSVGGSICIRNKT